MPELPEVETTKEGLKKIIGKNRIIEKIELKRKDLRFPIPKELPLMVNGKKIIKLFRRAKYLLIMLDDKTILISHLGMSGRWRERQKNEKLEKHDHVILHCSKGLQLIYSDPRRFGYLDYCHEFEMGFHRHFAHLGPEPNCDAFSAQYLFEKSRKRDVAIKNFIMNQEVVVGVGNIYAAESLFLSGIKPTKKTKLITKKQSEILVKNIKIVIDKAIKAGGSSINDFKQADGKLGYFQHDFKVYGRADKPCIKCKTILKNKVIGGRASVYCPKCQS